jgi:hypothetical protein
MLETVGIGFAPREFATILGLIAMAIIFGVSASAQAQNLVQDPNFTNGFADYTNVCCDVTTMPGQNGNIAVLPGGSTISQVIPTTPSSIYVISFVASFTGPGSYKAYFGDNSLYEPYTTPGMFAFSAPATGNNTTLSFITDTSGGTEYLSNLDVQPAGAPTPVPGAGLWSLALIVALGFPIHRYKKSAC